jgi:hypothetical protein
VDVDPVPLDGLAAIRRLGEIGEVDLDAFLAPEGDIHRRLLETAFAQTEENMKHSHG